MSASGLQTSSTVTGPNAPVRPSTNIPRNVKYPPDRSETMPSSPNAQSNENLAPSIWVKTTNPAYSSTLATSENPRSTVLDALKAQKSKPEARWGVCMMHASPCSSNQRESSQSTQLTEWVSR